MLGVGAEEDEDAAPDDADGGGDDNGDGDPNGAAAKAKAKAKAKALADDPRAATRAAIAAAFPPERRAFVAVPFDPTKRGAEYRAAVATLAAETAHAPLAVFDDAATLVGADIAEARASDDDDAPRHV